MKYRSREKSNRTKKLVVNITQDDHQYLKMAAADNNVSMAVLVLRALNYYHKIVMKNPGKFEQ